MINEKFNALRIQARACIDRIEAEEYYPEIWERVKSPTPPEQAMTKHDLLYQFQAMWEKLPDSPAIRRGAFWAICDLAEEYCFGEGEEK